MLYTDVLRCFCACVTGFNKQGGVGRISKVAGADGAPLYSVKYVLDGAVEHNLEACYISKYKNLDPSSRRSRPVSEACAGTSSTSEHSVKRQRRDPVTGKENRSANSPSTEQSGVKDNSNAMFREPVSQPIVLLSTSLDPHLQSKLTEFGDRCTGVTVTNNFSDAVTHVVVETDKRRVLKQRTMKYLQAIISKSPMRHIH
jgi:hypothetical protein